MILDHIASSTNAVVVTGPRANADVLGHGDLNMVNVAGVPDRLEQLVCKPQRQDVLNRFLAQVVVDTEDRISWKNSLHHLIQLSRRLQV